MSKNTNELEYRMNIRENNPHLNLTLEQIEEIFSRPALPPREKTMHTATFPAGEYYIGDLCYVMHEEWDEVIELMFPTERRECEGELTLADGRKFFYGSTAYGDGSYIDNRGGEYPVDAGIIGIIATNDISEADKEESVQCGNVYTFDEPFEITAHAGLFKFGEIEIDTAYFYENEEDEEDDEEDDDYDEEDEEDDDEIAE